MRWLKWQAPLPLLAKDLVEQAARRRTYVSRVVYAALLCLIFCLANYRQFARGGPAAFGTTGQGKEMFEALVILQFAGILLFLPATMSAALTHEKERGSMALLLLTSLKPRDILMQKYLGRLVPMFTFLLLGLPLLAICYAFGGMTSDYLLMGLGVLVLTCLQVGALALLCSSFCCTGLGALISSYVLTAVFYVGLPLLALFLEVIPWSSDETAFALVPLSLFGPNRPETAGAISVRVGLILLSMAVFLGLARAFLVSRAFLERKNRLLGLFRALDRFFEWANKVVGGLRLGRDTESLPDDRPIAWREVTRRSLGRPLYLFRVLVLIEVPVLFIAGSVVLGGSGHDLGWLLSLTSYGVAILATLAVTVMSANAIASERTSQTLDVLLTTPLAGRDIVQEKLRGVRRLRRVLLVPLATLFVVQAWWADVGYGYGYASWRDKPPVIVFGLMLAAVTVFLPLFCWVAFWIGLRVRTRFRAILGTLATLVAWNAVPPLLFVLITQSTGHHDGEPYEFLLLFSPAMCLGALEYGPPTLIGWVLVFLLLYGGLCGVFRVLCLGKADRYLGRAVPRGQPAKPLSAQGVFGILVPEDRPPSR